MHFGGRMVTMAARDFKYSKGVTLIEVMTAIFILTVVVLGTSGYRYYAALDTRRAAMHRTASRVGLLLCESWRGVKGAETYDLTADLGSELAITNSGIGPDAPSEFTKLNDVCYEIDIDSFHYWVTLSWRDLSTRLRALNIVVAWSQRSSGADGFADADKTFKLTTYTSM